MLASEETTNEPKLNNVTSITTAIWNTESSESTLLITQSTTKKYFSTTISSIGIDTGINYTVNYGNTGCGVFKWGVQN